MLTKEEQTELAELEKSAPQFVAGNVARPMCHGAWARFWSEPNTGDACDQAMRWLEAWRSDLAAAIAARANMDTDRLEWMSRAEQAEARLAAIDAQPVVAVIASDHGLLYIERALVAPTCVLRGSVPRNVCFVAADIVDHTDAPLIVAVNTQYLVVRGAYHKNSFRKFNIDKIDPLQIIWRMP